MFWRTRKTITEAVERVVKACPDRRRGQPGEAGEPGPRGGDCRDVAGPPDY